MYTSCVFIADILIELCYCSIWKQTLLPTESYTAISAASLVTCLWGRGATRTTRATTGSEVRVCMSTILISENRWDNLVGDSDIDTISQPTKNTLLDGITKKSPLNDWVVILVSGLGKDAVPSVGSKSLLVGVVGCKTLNLVNQVLVEVGLPNMTAVAFVSKGLVLEQSRVCMS